MTHPLLKTTSALALLLTVTLASASGGGGGGGGGGGSGGSSGGASVYQLVNSARRDMSQGKWDDAGKSLAQAMRLDDSNADVLNNMGYYTRKKPNGDAQQALQFYDKALKIDPKHKGAHEYMGEAYLMLKQPEKAKEHLLALEQICQKRCEEFKELNEAIEKYNGK